MGIGKVLKVIGEEVRSIHPRYLFFQSLIALLPHGTLSRVRTLLYRAGGLNVGSGTVIMGALTLTSDGPISSNLSIGSNCRINSPVYLEMTAPITIGSNVAIGHHVVFITTDHETGESTNRAGANKSLPISIEDGAWVGASSTILPGVTIGAGSVVAAGSLVSQSVPPNKVVGGVPARTVKSFGEVPAH